MEYLASVMEYLVQCRILNEASVYGENAEENKISKCMRWSDGCTVYTYVGCTNFSMKDGRRQDVYSCKPHSQAI